MFTVTAGKTKNGHLSDDPIPVLGGAGVSFSLAGQ